MSPAVEAFAQVAVIIVGMVSSLAAVTYIFVRGIMRANRQKRPQLPDDRLEHLQQSVDAIAVEVERIAEAQRFSAKLLAERPEGSAVER